eukprot:16429253-Heterocapsa_arctica.AAC.1
MAEKDTQIRKYIHPHYRIGEAANPGPGNQSSKQSKLGDYFHQHHTKKDDKDMWCKDKGYTIENIAGDGNCLYANLGRSRKLTGDRVRQIIHDNSDRLWSTHMQHDVDESELTSFKERTINRAEWGGYEQIIMWSKIYHIKIEI